MRGGGVCPETVNPQEGSMKAKLVERKEVADRTLAFRIAPEAGPVTFEPGQVCELTLIDPLFPDDLGNARIFSVASSPLEPGLLFATRLTGSAFKRSLAEGPMGMEMEVDGPYGEFTLHADAARPAIFLAGGIGITPFRSMVADSVSHRSGRRVTLVYSNRTASSVAFLDDLERWEREGPSFRLVATLTSPKAGEPWRHETGRVDRAFLERLLPERQAAIWYVVGPDAFVGAMDALLRETGVPPESVRTETFAGY
jgi:ferredoxin-NADP reductase